MRNRADFGALSAAAQSRHHLDLGQCSFGSEEEEQATPLAFLEMFPSKKVQFPGIGVQGSLSLDITSTWSSLAHSKSFL